MIRGSAPKQPDRPAVGSGRPVLAVEALYLTADDVAAMLQVHKATVFRMAKRDPTMPALVLGGVVRFPKERLLTWLRAREQGPGRGRRGPGSTAGGP